MRRYSRISVSVPENMLDLFLARVSELAKGKWHRDTELEATSNAYVPGIGIRYIHFVRNAAPNAELVFLFSDGELRLVNAFTNGEGISHALHGRLTADLWKCALRQACEELGRPATYTPTRTEKPEAMLPLEAAEALHRFATSANKATSGTSHSDDLADDMALWCHFLRICHTTGTHMPQENLEEYLTNRKFPEQSVARLLHGYESGLRLLELYDVYLAANPVTKVH